MKLKYILSFVVAIALCTTITAQETKKNLTREEILNMTTEEMSSLPLEQLMELMDIVGVSSLDELYDLILNKNVTSASKSAENLFDSPLSTTVITHDQIIASGATCIEEVLRQVPGVIVREKTNGNYDVHIRGNENLPPKNLMLYSENMNTLVMINGRPVFNYSHGGTLWETLPVGFEDIDRIEVVRGPSSALYGPNALSGVINIITQTITKESSILSGNVQSGSLSTLIGDIAYREKINDRWSIGITGNFETRDREHDKILIYDRGGSKYSLDGKSVEPGYFSLDQISRLTNDGLLVWPPYDVKGVTYDIYKAFPDPELAKERKGVNAYLDFIPQENTTINLMAGHQQSQVITSTMGDVPTPYTTKIASTSYIDLRAKYKDLHFQVNYNGGDITYMAGNEGFQLDNQQFNIQAEYDWNLGKLNIRPGLSYQSMAYDDSKHIAQVGNGYLNKKQTINILAGSARFDYSPTDKLRLVAALRAEQYNNPSDIYTSWQLVSSYKINDNNLIRAVYSRANQSSFLVNTYSNYTWNIVNMPYPRVMQFDGDPDHDLKTMDMIELGFRARPTKNLLIDMEAFYNESKGFGALMPSYSNVNITNIHEVLGDPTRQTLPKAIPDSVNFKYTNLALKSKQFGISINIDWIISEQLVANGHFTFQKTRLDNYMAYNRNELIGYIVKDATETAINDLVTKLNNGEIMPQDVPSTIRGESSSWPTDTKNDYEHKATPSYFGGFSLTYRPCKKLEILPQAYFYGEQSFENQYSTEILSSKFLLNTKVSYKANNKLTFFINGRNILNQKNREFAFMDNIGSLYLAGLNFKW